MKRLRVLILLAAAIVLAAGIAETCFADTGGSAGGSDSITVYVTITNDCEFIRGTEGTVMAHVPVTLSYFDLKDYGLEQYYRYDEENDDDETVLEQPTVLHLLIRVLEKYCARRTLTPADMHSDYINVTGGPKSIFLTRFWNHDGNLMYFVNHMYPLMYSGWGATADWILLEDGDEVEMALYTDWSFYTDSAFLYFDDVPSAPKADKAFTMTLMANPTSIVWDGIYTGSLIMKNESVRISTNKGKTWTYLDNKTDDSGSISLTLNDPGEYYIATGPKHSNYKDAAPAITVLNVTEMTEEERKEEEEEAARLAEEKRKAAEKAAAAAEEKRKAADEAAAAAEEKRKAAEEAATAAEEKRKAAEEAAKAAEEKRKVAEEAAATAEEKRKTAEEAAKTAEEKRKTAEEAAKAAEEKRKAAEEAAATAEEKRKTAEEAVEAAGEKRKAAEESRKAEEAAAKAAEEKRKAEEEAVKAAEEKRQAEEEAVKAAEEKRKAEEANARIAETRRRAAEEEADAAEERRKAAEEAVKAAEEKRKAAEEAVKAAEEKRKAEEEAEKAAEEKRKAEEEAARAAEEKRRAAEEKAQRIAEELAKDPEKTARGKAVLESIELLKEVLTYERKASLYVEGNYRKVVRAAEKVETLIRDENSTSAEVTSANAELKECMDGLTLKSKQKLTVKAAGKTYKASALKDRSRTFTAITVKNARGTVTYKVKVRGKSKKVLSLNKKNKKVMVKKGTGEGTYKIKVTVSATGDGEYLAAKKTITIKVVIK